MLVTVLVWPGFFLHADSVIFVYQIRKIYVLILKQLAETCMAGMQSIFASRHGVLFCYLLRFPLSKGRS